MAITKTYDLDMAPGGVPVVVHVSQYDEDFTLVFNLYASSGAFTVESGTTAAIRGTKKDGMGYSVDATMDVTNKKVTVAGDQQMTAVSGKQIFELTLTKSNKELNTANFILDVERAALDMDTITDRSVLRELEAIIESAEIATDAAERADDAAENVEDSVEQIETNRRNIAHISEKIGEESIGYRYYPIELGITDYTITEHGISITQYENGTVRVVGTPDTNVSFPLRNSEGYITVSLESGKTYRLKGCPAGGSSSKYGLDLRKSAIGSISYADYGEGNIFTLSESSVYYPHIRMVSGNTIDLLFTPEIAERSGTEIIVDVLTAKDAIVRETVDGIQEIIDNIPHSSSPNRNLLSFDDAEYTVNSVTITQDAETGAITTSGNASANIAVPISRDNGEYCAVTAEKGKYYNLSGTPNASGGGQSNYFLFLSRSVRGSILYANYGVEKPFIAENNETLYLHLRILKDYGDGLTFYPQLEQNTDVSNFIPYSDKSSNDDIARLNNEKNATLAKNTVMDGNIINAMLNCARSYIARNLTVQYGHRTAIHWYENEVNYTKDRLYDNKESYTPTEIDCSTLALLVLGGIPYEGSMYVGDTNYFGMAGYCYDIFKGDETARPSGGSTTLTHNMAQYFEDEGLGFVPAEDGSDLVPGDLLFFSYPNLMETNYRGIGHCEIFCHRATNFPNDFKKPTLITIGSDNNENASVQCYARECDWWNGTSSTGRKLAYVARVSLAQVKNRNFAVYTDPDYVTSQLVPGYPFRVDRYTPVTIEFDGTLNVVGAYFEITINNTKVLELFHCTEGLVGVRKHYKVVIPSSNADMTSFRIVGKNDNSAKINDVRIADGFNF